MRWSGPMVGLLVTLMVAPGLGGARTVMQGESPWDSGYPNNPQLYCFVQFDDGPGRQECWVSGNVQNVEVVRIRIVGRADVQVSVWDELGPSGKPEQRITLACNVTCVGRIPAGPFDDPLWGMRVWITAHTAHTTVMVDLERDPQFAPPWL